MFRHPSAEWLIFFRFFPSACPLAVPTGWRERRIDMRDLGQHHPSNPTKKVGQLMGNYLALLVLPSQA